MKATFTNIFKQILVGLFLLCLYVQANASYVDKFPITVTQPDGTEVHCFATGDDFYHWVHDENGFTLIRDPQTDVVVYATLENDELVSTGYRVGSIDPATTGLQPWTIISAEKRTQLRSDFLKNIPEKPVKEGYQTPRGGWNNGTINNIVMYIRFSDETEFPPKANIYDDMHNKDEAGYPSMYGYFKAVSNENTFIPTTFYPISSGNVIISYQDIYPRSYFQPYSGSNPNGYQGGDNGWERTEREHQLIARTVEAVKSQIPTSIDLDFNNDGLVDNLCFIVRGDTDPWATLLWPHRWALYTEDVFINGKQVWDFNMQIETHLDGSSASVLSHEMFHTLSAPDLYRYDYNGTPVGAWDLMASNTNPPQSTTAWMKYKYGGWVDNIPTITEGGTYTLHNVWSETNNAYRIASPNSSTEFFVVEYRNKSVYWDSDLSGSGLIIYRINTLVDGNADGPPDELYVYRLGGSSNMANDGNINAAFFSEQSGRTVFNDTSNPHCFLSNNQLGGIHIRNVSASGGETMSFEVVMQGLIVNLTELDFNNVKVGTTSTPQSLDIHGIDLTEAITYTKDGNDADAFDITETSWNPTTGGTLSITFSPTASKSYNATITVKSAGVTDRTITLKGKGIMPSLIVNPTELNFNDVPAGTTSTNQYIDAYGTDLTEAITYTKGGTDATAFDIDATAWNANGGLLSITFSPTEKRAYNATITFRSADAEDKTVTLTGNGTVGIDEQDVADGIVIYPNPTTGELKITGYRHCGLDPQSPENDEIAGQARNDIQNVEIFDVMGRNVLTVETLRATSLQSQITNHKSQIEMDISHLPAGIYFIRIQTENGVVTRKVVKM